jgi:hypothetical protein
MLYASYKIADEGIAVFNIKQMVRSALNKEQ